MLITKTFEIECAHRIYNHLGKCHSLHGHSYKIELGVEGNLNKEDMVVDYSDLKSLFKKVIGDKFDHSTIISKDDIFLKFCLITVPGLLDDKTFWEYLKDKINNIDDFKYQLEFSKDKYWNIQIIEGNVTAENLAYLWFNLLNMFLEKKEYILSYVKVWETPTSMACYSVTDSIIKE